MREKNNTNLERMRELIEQLTEADIAYYKNDAPIMTDLEYDRLTEELASLEHDTGLVLSGSPTQKVSGEILESLAEVRHTKPMLSAGKTKSIEDLIRFAAGRAVLLSWKMDGLTLVLRYEYGKLKQAITRGREGIIHFPYPSIRPQTHHPRPRWHHRRGRDPYGAHLPKRAIDDLHEGIV